MSLPVPRSTKPMLSKLQSEVPVGAGWLYEPKWDGFRAIVFREGDDIDIISRDGRPLLRYFPELPAILAPAIPEKCVMDGEIVIASTGRLDFDALLLRIHPAESRVGMLSRQSPASFIAFDLLALDETDLRDSPFIERRKVLVDSIAEVLVEPPRDGSRVWLTPQTDNVEEAEIWLTSSIDLGVEGVIAKRADLTYQAGKRAMAKIKRRKTADCVIGGYRLSKSGDGIGSLLLGLYDEQGVLHYVGHTSSFKAAERRKLLAELQPLRGDSFGEARTPGGPSRWSAGRETDWVSLRPELVCEVQFDKLQSGRFRHAATFVRWRTDRAPRSCTFEQLT